MKRSTKLLFLLLTLILFAIFINLKTPEIIGKVSQENFVYANVTRIVDGDTIDSSIGKIRFLGINTPEKSESLYSNAKNLTIGLIDKKEIKVIFGEEKTDMYGRSLGFIFIGNIFVNAELVRNGFASTFYMESLPSEFRNKLKSAEDEARSNGRGIWEKSENSCIVVKKLSYIEDKKDLMSEYILFENDCNYDIDLNGWKIKDEATHIYIFKNFIFIKNSEMKFVTGNCADSSSQICWNQKTPIWNDAGDQMFLKDASGKLAAYYDYRKI